MTLEDEEVSGQHADEPGDKRNPAVGALLFDADDGDREIARIDGGLGKSLMESQLLRIDLDDASEEASRWGWS
jgi:hypothetical protein